jgi:preprotein translocase subunit SecA
MASDIRRRPSAGRSGIGSKHDDEFRRKWYAEHVPLTRALDEEDEYLDDDYEDYDDEPFPLPDTVVREERRIGRNDPCPCGSGKKYKKCCSRKGNGAASFD